MLGPYYPIPFCFLAFLGYCIRYEVIIIVLFALAACVGLVICADLRPLMPPLLTIVYIVNIYHAPSLPTNSDYYSTLPIRCVTVMICVLIGLSFILHYLLWGRFKQIFTKRTQLTPYIIPLALALLLNGAGSETYVWKDTVIGVVTAVTWILIYLLFVHGLPKGKETIEYFCNTCQWISVLLIFEIIFIYLHNNVIIDGVIIENNIMFGWGINNNYGGLVAWLLPPLFYLAATRRNGWIQFLLAIASYACIIFSMCRSAMVVGSVIFLICLISVCFIGKNRDIFRTYSMVLLLGAVVGAIILRGEILRAFDFYLEIGFSDAGRFDIWREAVNIFKGSPLFGAGFYAAPFESWTGFLPGYCHNTLIELLCCCGAFGLLSYLCYRAKTVFILLRRMTVERFFLCLMIATILGVSLLDNHMFNIYPAFYYSIALALGELDYTETLRENKISVAPASVSVSASEEQNVQTKQSSSD